MFRPIYADINPLSVAVDSAETFESGVVGQLASDEEIVVSDGVNPYGLLDGYKTTTFHKKIVNESVVLNGVTASNLANTNLTASSNRVTNAAGDTVYTETTDYTINATNGTITRVALGNIADGETVLVSYEYQVSVEEYLEISQAIGASDDTSGSGQITVWYGQGIYDSDQYDITRTYAINNLLYADSGIITNTNAGISGTAKVIGRVVGVPVGGAVSATDPYPALLRLELNIQL